MSLPTQETPISEKQQNPKIASSKFSLQLKGPGGWAWKLLVGTGSFEGWAARDAVWAGILAQDLAMWATGPAPFLNRDARFEDTRRQGPSPFTHSLTPHHLQILCRVPQKPEE